MSRAAQKSRFYNHPIPKEGPDVPYQNEAPPNPVLRGYPLAIAVWIINCSNLVSGILWKNAKFDKLKEIKELDGYEPRHDPTVIPVVSSPQAEATSIHDIPDPKPRADPRQHYTSADYVSSYKSGDLTPSSVAEAVISLISNYARGKHAPAFLEWKAELVREAARASTERYEAGKPLGPLDGVLVAVKDEVELKGYKRTLGSQLDFKCADDETAWCVKQWEEAGAIVIAKTNMHEIGLDTTNNNPLTGTPLNPHNPRHYAGGSSGGSAYAVSSGLVPIALGADGGGSIRIPSSLCGIYGLKPSHGRISGRPTYDLGCSVGVYGPMSSSIDDLRLAYRIMAKPDPGQLSSGMFPDPFHQLPPAPSPPHQTKYLGICTPWLSRADPIIHELISQAITYYITKHNYKRIEIPLPLLPESQKSHALTILSEIGSSPKLNDTSSSSSSSGFNSLSYPSQLLLSIVGRHATAQDFLAAQKLRNLMMRHLAWLWQRYPGMVLVTPTIPTVGSPIKDPQDVKCSRDGRGNYGVSDGDASLQSMEFAFLANWTGCPAVSAPIAYIGEGEDKKEEEEEEEAEAEGKPKPSIPVGIMGMGEWGSEETLLDWAEEGRGFLAHTEPHKSSSNSNVGGQFFGPKKPHGWEDAWIDVLHEASSSSSAPSTPTS